MTQKLNATALAAMSVSDLLDLPWDAIEEAASYALPPQAAYLVTVVDAKLGTVGKDNDKKESISLEFAIDETVELLNETDKPVDAGTKFDINYIGGTGSAYFKRDFGAVAQAFGIASLREFLEKLKGAKVSLILSHRAGKNDAKYAQISDVQLLG